MMLTTPCVIPGCRTPLVHVGDVCESCRCSFGDYLHATDAPRLTQTQIDARDHAVRATYAKRRTP